MKEFQRTGELKDIGSYPLWLQQVVRDTQRDKLRVVDHELFALMRDSSTAIVRRRERGIARSATSNSSGNRNRSPTGVP